MDDDRRQRDRTHWVCVPYAPAQSPSLHPSRTLLCTFRADVRYAVSRPLDPFPLWCNELRTADFVCVCVYRCLLHSRTSASCAKVSRWVPLSQAVAKHFPRLCGRRGRFSREAQQHNQCDYGNSQNKIFHVTLYLLLLGITWLVLQSGNGFMNVVIMTAMSLFRQHCFYAVIYWDLL